MALRVGRALALWRRAGQSLAACPSAHEMGLSQRDGWGNPLRAGEDWQGARGFASLGGLGFATLDPQAMGPGADVPSISNLGARLTLLGSPSPQLGLPSTHQFIQYRETWVDVDVVPART